MAKTTRTLSGASQDAYFRRVLKACPGLATEQRDQLVRRLRSEVAQVRLRLSAKKAVPAEHVEAVAPMTEVPTASDEALVPPAPAPAQSAPFDPFSPNVIVVLRKAGRDAAVAALQSIASYDDLLMLAREQRLTIPAGLGSSAEVRAAIVTAAEHRVANRMAAAT